MSSQVVAETITEAMAVHRPAPTRVSAGTHDLVTQILRRYVQPAHQDLQPTTRNSNEPALAPSTFGTDSGREHIRVPSDIAPERACAYR